MKGSPAYNDTQPLLQVHISVIALEYAGDYLDYLSTTEAHEALRPRLEVGRGSRSVIHARAET